MVELQVEDDFLLCERISALAENPILLATLILDIQKNQNKILAEFEEFKENQCKKHIGS